MRRHSDAVDLGGSRRSVPRPLRASDARPPGPSRSPQARSILRRQDPPTQRAFALTRGRFPPAALPPCSIVHEDDAHSPSLSRRPTILLLHPASIYTWRGSAPCGRAPLICLPRHPFERSIGSSGARALRHTVDAPPSLSALGGNQQMCLEHLPVPVVVAKKSMLPSAFAIVSFGGGGAGGRSSGGAPCRHVAAAAAASPRAAGGSWARQARRARGTPDGCPLSKSSFAPPWT